MSKVLLKSLRCLLSPLLLLFSVFLFKLCLPFHFFQVLFVEHFLMPSTFLDAESILVTKAYQSPLTELIELIFKRFA